MSTWPGHSFSKSKRVQSKHIRDYARAKHCTVRYPGICNGNPETSVLSHDNGAGMALKHSDLFGAISCSDCHNETDGVTSILDPIIRLNFFLLAIMRTQALLLRDGLIFLKGQK